MRHHLAEHLVEAPVVQATRAQDEVAGDAQGVGDGGATRIWRL
jgi:hypothetical protein